VRCLAQHAKFRDPFPDDARRLVAELDHPRWSCRPRLTDSRGAISATSIESTA
jgi:hypothetical protein